MGSWGAGLFEDDVARDVEQAFEAAMASGASVPAATRQVLDAFRAEAADEDDGPVVILALAVSQWRLGKLQEKLKGEAFAVLEAGRGLQRWADEDEATLSARRAVYEQLRVLLGSPSPPMPPPARRARRKANFREGDWFAVPLEGGGFAVGMVARYRKGYGPGLFAYFFGPRRLAVPSIEELTSLGPGNAIHSCVLSYLGLVDGAWPVIGQAGAWNPDRWPLPLFQRRYLSSGVLVRYSEVNLDAVEEWPANLGELEGLPDDGTSGYGAVQLKLSSLLPAS